MSLFDGLAQTVVQQMAVGQAGQIIVRADESHAFLISARQCDVAEHTDEMGDLAAVIGHLIDGQPVQGGIAIFECAPGFALPLSLGAQSLGDFFTAGLIVVFGINDFGGLTHQFRPGIARAVEKCLIDGEDAVLQIGDEYAFDAHVKNFGGQAHLRFRPATYRDVLQIAMP